MYMYIKRIDKNWILSTSVVGIHDYEYIICEDNFSTKFVNDLNPLEFTLRVKLLTENISGCPNSWMGYNGLSSLSESFISLTISPNWLDIHFVKEKLSLNIEGYLDIKEQSEIVKGFIIEYYSKK